MAKRTKKKASTPSHLADRVKALQSRLQESKADALLVSNAVDIRYLTGFIGDDSWAVVPASGKSVAIISDGRFTEQIAREAPHCKAIIRTGPMPPVLKKLMDQRKWDAIGLQPAHTTLAARESLVKELGAKRLEHWDDGLFDQRSVKITAEVSTIRKALKIQQQAFRNTLKFIEPGKTEEEVAAYLEYQMRSLGADGRSFPTIVAADGNAALPHAIPGKKKIRKNGLLLIDWGAKYNGYCSDLTRVVGVGGMSKKMREVYQVVLDAQLAAIDAIAPGKALKDIDAVARKIITKAGYGKQFNHSLGHGIGLDIHEQPRLAKTVEGELEPGQVVTVEPGIYLPGVGGVRIEDDVLVTKAGHSVLSDLPKDLESAII